jgi:FkbM family methyltransferase
MNPPEHVAELQAAEIRVFRALAERVPTRTLIDVGAHHGTALVPFLEAGWRVWAFEPIEANRERLQARAGNSDRLTVRPEAVSDRSGTARLQLALKLDGSLHDYYHSLERTRADRYHRKGASVDVPVVSLDDLVARGDLPPRVGFLKVDTEGHDLAVLRGASRLGCDVVGVEFWGDRHPLGRSPSPAPDMVRLMAARGHDSYLVLCHQGGETFVLGSGFDGVRPDAWGNLLFFHHSRQDLYRGLLAELGRPVPAAPPARPGGGERFADETEALLEQTRVLQQSCDERLQVIEQFQKVAEERLGLISALDAEAARVRAAAEERLALILSLGKDVRLAQSLAQEREAVIRTLENEVRDAHAVAGARLAALVTLEKELRRTQDAAAERLALAHRLDEELREARAVAEGRLAVIQSQGAEIHRLVAAEQARLLAKLRRAVRRVLPARVRTFARRLLGRGGPKAS